MSRRVIHGDRILQIYFPFDDALRAVVKTLPGRYWNGREKHWAVPNAHVVAVVDLLFPEQFEMCNTTRRLYLERGGTLDLETGPVVPSPTARQLSFGDGGEARTHARSQVKSSDFTVSRLNRQVQAALKATFRAPIWVVAEISGFNKNARKKVVDFQLVERDSHGKVAAEVRATLFEDIRWVTEDQLSAAGNPFRLEDEVQIRARGHVDLYVPWGTYRFVIDELDVDFTLGEAARRREEIRRQLIEEGLLERNRSLSLPVLPLRVGLVTSIESDAYNDVVQTLRRSGFAFHIMVHGVRVQGRQTEPSVLNALARFSARASDIDVLLICRGGGSRTDLAWFDSLVLARAVATFPLPVLIGIGHEKDLSALDLVGWSHKTPTAAAEWLVHQVRTASDMLERQLKGIRDGSRRLMGGASSHLADLASRVPRAATVLIEREATHLRDAMRRLRRGARRELSSASRHLQEVAIRVGPQSSELLSLEAERTESRRRQLVLLEPRRVVERGYAILRLGTGKALTDPRRAPRGTALVAELKGGALRLRSEGSEEK